MRWVAMVAVWWVPVLAFAELEVAAPISYDLVQLTAAIKANVLALEGLSEERARGVLKVRRLSGEFTEQEVTAIQNAINNHVPVVSPDPDAELVAAIGAVESASIVDPNAKAAVEALKNALLGKTRQGKVKAERP